ncbi:MAG: hypothetical protein J5848_07120 [Bacteroidales bacterium]|nr:hypothetical protein [Bacteroidales bacterium]
MIKRLLLALCIFSTFSGCSVLKNGKTRNVEGLYCLFLDSVDVYENANLPAILINEDFTFEYTVPGLGGPYYSRGTWRPTHNGIFLSTELTCEGANIKKIGHIESKDSTDIIFQLYNNDSLKLNYVTTVDWQGEKTILMLDSCNHIRVSKKTLRNISFFEWDLFYFPICKNFGRFKGGLIYSITLLYHGLYPFIYDEEWLLFEDTLIRESSKQKNTFIKRH